MHFALAESSIDYIGVFARQRLLRNTCLELDINHADEIFRHRTENIGPCTNPAHNRCWIYLDGDFGEYFNHHAQPNARLEFDPESDVLQVRFLRDIEPGEEVTVDYGPDYDVDGVNLITTIPHTPLP